MPDGTAQNSQCSAEHKTDRNIKQIRSERVAADNTHPRTGASQFYERCNKAVFFFFNNTTVHVWSLSLSLILPTNGSGVGGDHGR